MIRAFVWRMGDACPLKLILVQVMKVKRRRVTQELWLKDYASIWQ